MNKLIDFLKNEVADCDVLCLWNEYVSENYADDTVYESIEEIADSFSENAADFARRVFFGKIKSWNASYFCVNGSGNIVGFWTLTDDDSPVDYSLLADWLIDSDRLEDIDYPDDDDDDDDD